MGLSGSGKSSLLRCINGLNTVSRGKLFVEHEGKHIDIAHCTPAELKMMRTKRIAMVFQKFALMPWLTVRENISFGLEMQGRPEKERRKLVDEARAGGPDPMAQQEARRALRRHAAARGPGPGAGHGRRHPADGRTLLGPRPADPPRPAGRVAGAAEQAEQDHRVRQPRPDEALKLGSRIAIMKDGRIIQYSKPEEIVLNPADDYVRTFVAHTNPLNVLCGRSLMRSLDNCKRVNGSVCLDPGGDSWLDLGEGNSIKRARQGQNGLDLQNWVPGRDVETLGRKPTLVNANIGMREALQIRYHTGNKLVLQENDKVVGILGDSELYHALLGKNHG